MSTQLRSPGRNGKLERGFPLRQAPKLERTTFRTSREMDFFSQKELVTQTGVALEAISIVTEQLTNLVQNICTAAENQSRNSQLAVNAISEIFRIKNDNASYLQEMHQLVAHLLELVNSLSLRMAAVRFREH